MFYDLQDIPYSSDSDFIAKLSCYSNFIYFHLFGWYEAILREKTILNTLTENRLLQSQAWKWDPGPWFIHHNKKCRLVRWPGEGKIFLPPWRPYTNNATPSTNREDGCLHSISSTMKIPCFIFIHNVTSLTWLGWPCIFL